MVFQPSISEWLSPESMYKPRTVTMSPPAISSARAPARVHSAPMSGVASNSLPAHRANPITTAASAIRGTARRSRPSPA